MVNYIRKKKRKKIYDEKKGKIRKRFLAFLFFFLNVVVVLNSCSLELAL